MKTRLLAILLCLVMTVSVLTACGSEKEKTYLGSDTGTGNAGSDETFAYVDEYVADLAKNFTYNGDTFSVVGKGGDHCEEPEITGNLENDALYNRMREIEETFGITFTY